MNGILAAFIKLRVLLFQMFVDFHGHSRKKNVFIYGCHDNKGVKTNQLAVKDRIHEESHENNESFCEDDAVVKVYPRFKTTIHIKLDA